MAKRSSRGSRRPGKIKAYLERAFLIGTRSANSIRASGHYALHERVGAFDLTEIAKPVRCFHELGEESYPVIVHEADEPRRDGEAAELEQIRSARPALPVTSTGFARGYALDMADMGFVEIGNGHRRVDIGAKIHWLSPSPTRGKRKDQPLKGHGLRIACGIVLRKDLKTKPALIPTWPRAGLLGPSFKESSFFQAAERAAAGPPATRSGWRQHRWAVILSPTLAPAP
jgi:hypothetical protein